MSTNGVEKTVILVTGANKGVGYEIAKQLAEASPSYEILLGSRSLENGTKAVESIGQKNVIPVKLDITSDKSIEDCVSKIRQDYGRLDCLINNAGIAGEELPKDTPPRDRWRTILETNVISVFMLTNALAELLDRSNRPSVIMVSSSLGSVSWTLTSPGWSVYTEYSGSKAALNNLMANFVRMRKNWKTVCYSPGLVSTDLNGWYESPFARPVSDAAVDAVRLVADMGKEDGPNGTFTTGEGVGAW